MGVIDPKYSDIRAQSKKSPEKYVERARETDDEFSRKKFKDVLSGKDGNKAKKAILEVEEGLPSAMSLVSNAARKKAMKDAEGEAGDSELDDEVAEVQMNLLAQQDIDVEVESPHISTAAERIEKIDDLREMYKMLVASIVELKTTGRTDTTLTLHYPPLFNGAKLTVTEFSNAKGEYNITFSELTPQAKALVDLQINRDLLLHSLQEKGYMVHILIATTEKENVTIAQEEAANQARNQQQQQDQQQQQQQEKEEKDKK